MSDPSGTGPQAQGPDDAGPHAWGVGELHAAVTGVLGEVFGDPVWVDGEIAQLNRSPAGHVYITLVDAGGDHGRGGRPQLSVTLFLPQQRRVERQLRAAGGQVELVEGIRVRIGGTIGTYAARSTFQLRMSDVDPTFTLGVLGQERSRVLAALDQDGLIGRNADVPLDELPLRVALVTSTDSAAHADALHELEHSGVPFTVHQLDARTQGVEAVESLLRALRAAAELPVDVVLIVRGGGAATDLAAFDDERLARAVATMPLPVVVGIGHETDRSVVDEVAHHAAKTPTAAAAYLAQRASASIDRLDGIAAAVRSAAGSRLDRAAARLDRAAQSIATRSERTLVRGAARVDDQWFRVRRAADRRLERAADRVEALGARARIHDPAATLARGWSITRTRDGRVVRDPAALPDGTVLTTTLAGGSVDSVVTGRTATDAATDGRNHTDEPRSERP